MQQTNRTIDINRFKNAVGITLSFSNIGNRRKVGSEAVTVNGTVTQQEQADAKKRLSVNKKLLECAELDAIKTFYGEIYGWVKARTVPSFFKDGFYLASLQAVETIQTRLKKAAEEELPPMVSALLLAYPGKVLEAQAALGPLFNAADYPTEEALEQAFSIRWNWIAFTTPEALPPELRQAEEDKLKKQFADASEQILDALRVSFQELLTHAVERLTPGEDGKPRIFRDSLITNIQGFLDTFSSRNIMNDTALAALVDQAKAVMGTADPERLRKLSSVREEATAKFTEIKTALDGMIETKKSRQFSFDD